MGLLDRLRGRKPKDDEKKKAAPKEGIIGYELYECSPRGTWKRLQELDEEVEFEEFEDAMPGFTYRLSVRTKSGHLHTIWHRSVPGGVEEKIIDPLERMTSALAPMAKFGEKIEELKDNIQKAFGWALPQQTGGGGGAGSPTYKGELPVLLHPVVPEGLMAWTPVLREWTKGITEGVREGILGNGSAKKEEPEKKVEFTKPPPKPEDYMEPEAAEPEAQ